MGEVAVWRHSYHESGVRSYYPLPDVVVERPEPGPAAGQFVGTERLVMRKPPFGAVAWNYTPKVRRNRKNLIVDAAEHFEVDVWIVEAGRADLAQQTVDQYLHVIDTEVLDDCDPMVLAIAWSFPPEFWDAVGPTHLDSMASFTPVTPPEGE